MTFGSLLKAARKEKKLTQKELASLISAAHNSISNWENDQNKPDPDTIENLCWALNVSPNYFFSNSEKIQAKKEKPPTVSDEGLYSDIHRMIDDLPENKLQEAKSFLDFLKSKQDNL